MMLNTQWGEQTKLKWMYKENERTFKIYNYFNQNF